MAQKKTVVAGGGLSARDATRYFTKDTLTGNSAVGGNGGYGGDGGSVTGNHAVSSSGGAAGAGGTGTVNGSNGSNGTAGTAQASGVRLVLLHLLAGVDRLVRHLTMLSQCCVPPSSAIGEGS